MGSHAFYGHLLTRIVVFGRWNGHFQYRSRCNRWAATSPCRLMKSRLTSCYLRQMQTRQTTANALPPSFVAINGKVTCPKCDAMGQKARLPMPTNAKPTMAHVGPSLVKGRLTHVSSAFAHRLYLVYLACQVSIMQSIDARGRLHFGFQIVVELVEMLGNK